MKISKPIELNDISQALARGACPLCAYLRNQQSALLRGEMRPEDVTELCNFHAWALAAAIDSGKAAQVFLHVLNHGRALRTEAGAEQCSFCSRLLQEEITQLKELVNQMNKGLVMTWMKQQGTLCRAHAEHLRRLAPLELRPVIDDIVERSAKALADTLEDLIRRSAAGKVAGGGALGRAAEFLTSQRGINR